MTRRLMSSVGALMLASVCNCTTNAHDADPAATDARALTTTRARHLVANAPKPAETDGPEAPLDPPMITLLSPPYQETAPAIVATGTGGTEALIAWFDGRTSGITATLVDGTTLQPLASTQTGIALVDRTGSSDTLNGSEAPGLATNGAELAVVAWTEEHLDKSTYAFAERFDPTTGIVVPADVGGVQLGPTGNDDNPVVAWDGSQFVVAWAGVSATTGQMATPILMVRIDPTSGANAADGQGALLTTASSPLTGPLLAGCAPAACLFAWNDSTSETYFYPRGGPASSSAPAIAPTGGTVLGVATDGARFLVGVNVATTTLVGGVPTRVFNLGAGVYSLAGVYQSEITALNVGQDESFLAGFVWDGDEFVSAANDAFYFVNGSTIASTSQGLPVDYRTVGLALVNASLVVVEAFPQRNGFFGGAPDAIEAASFNPSTLAKVTPLQLESIGAASERAPFIVASQGSGGIAPTVFSWRATPTSDSTLYAARVDPTSGDAIASDADGLVVATNLTSNGIAPDVPPVGGATDGAREVVAYATSASRGFYFGVFDPATDTFGATPVSDIMFGGALSTIRAAYGAGTYMVATADGARVVATAFDSTTFAGSAGPLRVSDGSLTSSTSDRNGASIAFDGSRFLFVWSDGRSGVDTIYGAHVAASAVVVEADGFAVSNGVFSETEPSIATHENGALVVWRDTRDEDRIGNIYGRRLDGTGAPIGSDFAISAAVGDQSNPVVVDAGDGLNYQVVWTDMRNDAGGDIYGTLVGIDGTVRQPSGDALATSSDAETAPALATTAAGALLLSYVRHDTSIGLGTDRVRTRVLGTGSVAGKCTSDNDCATLHCADGVCCNVACDGSCQTCNGASPGICTSVIAAPDPDTCAGKQSCNAKGTCTKVIGQMCGAASDCVSGFCVDGVCCNSACVGGCNACALTPATTGACTLIPAGSTGVNPSCIPDTCDGVSASCPTGCTSDAQCVRPYTCSATGACELRAAATCKDAQTLEASDGTMQSCAPYACENSGCVSVCHSVKDCAAGSLCDERNVCVPPVEPDEASGCDLSRGAYDRWSASVAIPFGLAGLLVLRRRRRARSTIRET